MMCNPSKTNIVTLPKSKMYLLKIWYKWTFWIRKEDVRTKGKGIGGFFFFFRTETVRKKCSLL